MRSLRSTWVKPYWDFGIRNWEPKSLKTRNFIGLSTPSVQKYDQKHSNKLHSRYYQNATNGVFFLRLKV